MRKKILLFLILLSIVAISQINFITPTNSSSTPWTIEKASHLANKALYSSDIETIKTLFLAGSAQNAVALILPDQNGPDRTLFNADMATLTGDVGFDMNNRDNAREYYIKNLKNDPYIAKMKLFSVFEDTFSVFKTTSKDITYTDIRNAHETIYKNTLGNYKQMVKSVLLDTDNSDYALGKFLDLFNQTNPRSPNENYGRELMQLFLMEEYKPGESEVLGNTRNYSEQDVNAVSKILFGFESNPNTHEVTFNNLTNTNTTLEFLSGDLKIGDSFAFYDELTGEIDINILKNSIAGNNGLPDNTIDYIFSKREDAIAAFIANKLYKFYVADSQDISNIALIKDKLIQFDFDIFQTVTWLLADDMMYSNASVTEISYKNPLELITSTFKVLQLSDNSINIHSLSKLGWNPYDAPNIFGRDGFDNNAAFFTAYTNTQWVTEVSRYINQVDITDLLGDAVSLTTFIGNHTEFDRYQFYTNKQDYFIITGTGHTLQGNITFDSFVLTNSSGTLISTNTGSLDFSNLSIQAGSGITITLSDAKLVYDDFKLYITAGQYNNSGAIENISGEAILSNSYVLEEKFTPESLIGHLEDKLFGGKRLTTTVKNKLISFLTTDSTGVSIDFDYLNTDYRKNYVKGLIHLMLSQPEFILKTGYNVPTSSSSTNLTNAINNNSHFVIIKMGGGLDYLNAIIPKNEYAKYLEYRGSGALIGSDVLSLNDDYYINSDLSEFKSLYDQGYLKIINRVGTPKHSRAHDAASRKMTSLNAISDIEDNGIIGDIIKNEDFSKTVVLGGYKPLIFRGGNYLNIGSNAYYVMLDGSNTLTKEYKIKTINDIQSLRAYPGDSRTVFANATTIHTAAKQSQLNGGRPGSGYSMEDNFTFLKSLVTTNIGNIVRMSAQGGYDTHKNQRAGLKRNLGILSSTTNDFFQSVKDTSDITIIIYSEFGRTNKINTSLGTDHGKAGGIFVISNNTNLQDLLPKKDYGNMSFINAKANRLGVGIDYRSVYSKVFSALYSIDMSTRLKGIFDMDTYIDATPVDVSLFRRSYEYVNSTVSKVWLRFDIKDANFLPEQASYVKIQYGKDPDNLYEESRYNVDRYMSVEKDSIDIYLKNIEKNQKYFYKISVFDNQYNLRSLEGSFYSSDIITSTTPVINKTTDSLLAVHRNTLIGSGGLELSGSGIALEDVSEYSNDQNNKIVTQSGTYITDIITSGTGALWDGVFTLPTLMSPEYFISDTMMFNTSKISDLSINKILNTGSDNINLAMKLNKTVQVVADDIDNTKTYGVLTSISGKTWIRLPDNMIELKNNTLEIKTDVLGYFIIAQTKSNGDFILATDPVIITPPVENNPRSGGGGGGRRLIKDTCKYGDYSVSYYDKSCGIDPDAKVALEGLEMTQTYRAEQLVEQHRENAENNEKEVIEQNIKKENAFGFDNDFLIFESEKSFKKVGEYSIIQVSKSRFNKKIKAIAEFVIKKDFSNSYEQSLIATLNSLGLELAVFDLKIKNKTAKKLQLITIKKRLGEFLGEYKKAKKAKIAIKFAQNTNISVTSSSQNTGGFVTENKTPTTIKKDTINNNDISNEKKPVLTGVNYEYLFEVNTGNIKLKKDPYWKENNGLLKKGDRVEQVTRIHAKGFFKVIVRESKTTPVGTTGYIFKKYLTK